MPQIIMRMLDLMDRPGFLVKDNHILHCNQSAKALHIQPETSLEQLLSDCQKLYNDFSGDIMHMQLYIQDKAMDVTVERIGDYDLFYLASTQNDPALSALAIASTQLRMPLMGLMNTPEKNDPQTVRLLCQLHRAVSNMSDALRYSKEDIPQLQVYEMSAWLAELIESVTALQKS